MAEQIATLRSAGLMNSEDSKILSGGANFLRSVDHAIRLVTGKAADGLPDRAGHAELVENLARRWGLIEGSGTLASSLHETRQRVREVYSKLVEAAP
jgi:glutamine synthetase adenylyltransferase